MSFNKSHSLGHLRNPDFKLKEQGSKVASLKASRAETRIHWLHGYIYIYLLRVQRARGMGCQGWPRVGNSGRLDAGHKDEQPGAT